MGKERTKICTPPNLRFDIGMKKHKVFSKKIFVNCLCLCFATNTSEFQQPAINLAVDCSSFVNSPENIYTSPTYYIWCFL